MNLLVAAKLIKSLMAYLSEKRDCFEEYESRAKGKSHIDDYQDVTCKTVQQHYCFFFFLDGGRNTDEVLQGSRKFKVEIYTPIIDPLVNNLEKKEYEEIFEKFGFWKAFMFWMCEITKQCEKVDNFYNKDLNSQEITSE
jgi:hypothetical protein